MIDIDLLAAALIAYEADEPHTGEDASTYYPAVDVTQYREWLSLPHDGDCVQQPQPCRRCHADGARHKARWLRNAMEAAR